MNDVLKAHEAKSLTKNPGVTDKAIATYYRLSAAVK
jgi:hypothetical protein